MIFKRCCKIDRQQFVNLSPVETIKLHFTSERLPLLVYLSIEGRRSKQVSKQKKPKYKRGSK